MYVCMYVCMYVRISIMTWLILYFMGNPPHFNDQMIINFKEALYFIIMYNSYNTFYNKRTTSTILYYPLQQVLRQVFMMRFFTDRPRSPKISFHSC